ncbi:MAG: M20/M25/M40 family metallo-hydrolase [Deltaproteobacteria bacterium]|nr:M20/M25/M40 family metallo-hydrolase [Deltaproteobacteria bacterium]
MRKNNLDQIREQVLREVRADRLIELASAICDVHSPTGQEAEVARLIQSLMHDIGMRAILQEVEEGRPNVIGILEGSGSGRTLMFNGHMDTSFPFLKGTSAYGKGILERPLPSEVDGEWLYGTGVENMKAGIACYLGAVEALQRAGIRLAGDILIAGCVGEVETSAVGRFQGQAYRGFGHGSRYLITHGGLANFCIIGEPSNLKIGVGTCGTVWLKITSNGPVTGAYRSDWETNPINRAMRLMEGLQSWRTSFIERYRHHSIDPVVTISGIEGGWPWRASRSPGSCSIYVDVRTAPDQALISVKEDLVPLVRSFDPEDKRYRSEVEFYASIPGGEISLDEEIVQVVQDAHTAVHGHAASYRYSHPLNDGVHISRYGIPTVVYGPGGASRDDVVDPKNEYVRVENLVNCAKVYALVALEVCNLSTAS